MKYPSLVRKKECKTDIHIVLYSEEISEEGSPIIALEGDYKCNYQDKSKRVITKEKSTIQVNGVVILYEDIAPELATISSGKVTVFGITRDIYQGTKARNPDGTVNYVQLEIM